MSKGGLVVTKQEMTKMWIDDNHMPVTLLKIEPQEIIRYKVADKDGYDAMVVWANKKNKTKENWKVQVYGYKCEFKVPEDFMENYGQWSNLDLSLLEWVEDVALTGYTKWKWFQGTVKRFGFAEWPKTHGSRNHRQPGSIGSMKPRRVIKWKKLPGRMGNNKKTLKNVKILDRFDMDDEQLIAVHGSVPWAYKSFLKLFLK